MSLPVTEPERFEYVPGKGIACSLDGEQIVVGNRAFLEQRQVDIAQSASAAGHCFGNAGGPERTPAGVAAH